MRTYICVDEMVRWIVVVRMRRGVGAQVGRRGAAAEACYCACSAAARRRTLLAAQRHRAVAVVA